MNAQRIEGPGPHPIELGPGTDRGLLASSANPGHRWLAPAVDGSTPATSTWMLELSGDWRGAAPLQLNAAPLPGPPTADLALQFNLQQLQAWDAGLAAALHQHLASWARAGAHLELSSLPREVRAVLELSLPRAGQPPAAEMPAEISVLQRWDASVRNFFGQSLLTVRFLGEVLLALGRVMRPRPGRPGLSGRELLRQIDLAGPLSLPIVSLTCFLVGLMLAYMGGAQLDRMGAQRFIADLVTVGMVRDLAGLMTGMILAGRIGSAYAAQLATMKGASEIDALRALGVNPIDHLVLPRVLALVLISPLIWAYAALVGVLAGVVPTALAYGVPAQEYLNQALGALTWSHVWVGIFKCSLYTALLALAGCREGMYAGRSAQAVGQATTRAVVKGIVWVIAAATGSTILMQSLGI